MVRYFILLYDSGLTYPVPVNPKTGKPAGMISQETFDIVMANAETLDSAVIYNRDFNYNL